MPAFLEEIFGPVAPVIVAKDADEAVAVANNTDYGLVAAIQTGSVERGLTVADRLNTGIVQSTTRRWTTTRTRRSGAPARPETAPGSGRRAAGTSFTQWQWITSRPQAHGFPL